MPLFISVFDMFLCIARNSVLGSFLKGRWEAFQNFGRIYTPDFRFCGKNLNCNKDGHVEKSYFPLKLILSIRDYLVNIYRYFDL